MRNSIVLAILANGLLRAQDIAGDWQGLLGKSEPRVVITIARGVGGDWTASEVTPDDGSNPALASSVTFDGSTLKIVFDTLHTTYEGTLSARKNSFKGTLTLLSSPLPVDLDRATEQSSWRRDQAPHTTDSSL
jgi:hypothetical protein